MRNREVIPVALLVALLLTKVARAADAPPEPVEFQMAVYLLDAPAKQLAAQMAALQAKEFADLPTLDADPLAAVTKPGLRFRAVPAADYAPPDEQSLKHFGRGLDAAQTKKLQQTKTAWVIDFAAPPDKAAATVRRAGLLMHRLAVDNGAVVWDELTREVFTADAWKGLRLDAWSGDVPEAQQHVTIHYYIPEGASLPRAITLGMGKFGRPDVVVEQVPRDNAGAVRTLINVTCQALVEGPPLAEKAKSLDLDVRALKHPSMKKLADSFLEGATAKAKVTLRDGKHLDGDPDNRLIELRFDTYPGNEALERQVAAIAQAFGSRDKVTQVKDDDPEITAARKRAQVAIAQKKVDFRKGLPLGDHLLVKAGFKTKDNGQEWMWVEVVRWDGNNIRGILQNDPFEVPDLKAGATVTVNGTDLFDYILYHANGKSEGNETGAIMARKEKEQGGKPEDK